MARKLFIFDTADRDNFDQAVVRFRPNEVEWIGAEGAKELKSKQDLLVKRRATFDRVLVQTHGGPGVIKFGTDNIWDTTLIQDYVPRNYHLLFPTFTRIYFDGCNVGSGGMGDDFIQVAGQTFLKMGGGEVLAWTSPGYVWGWLPFIGSHTRHWTGDLKTAVFSPVAGKAIRVY